MKLTRKNIKPLILKDFNRKGRLTSSDIVDKYKISRQAVNRHLHELIKAGHVIRQGTGRSGAFYLSTSPRFKKAVSSKEKRFSKRLNSAGLMEDKVFKDIESQAYFLEGLSLDAKENLHYAFTEMLNNAIDHSRSKLIDIDVRVNKIFSSFSVRDFGIGVFENVMVQKGLANEMEAVQDILKGKTTTAPSQHSGEGIFFTSKIANRFVLESHKNRIIVDNNIDDVFFEPIRQLKGTKVLFEISSSSNKKLPLLFKEFTNEDFQFDKSAVKVKLFDSGESYMSRSQAKRLLHSMESFGNIELDFEGVTSIGQGFADEIFRVFQNAHPDIKIDYINCSEHVRFMIERAKAA